MAKAYFIGQFEIHDSAGYDVYRSQTAATLSCFKAREREGSTFRSLGTPLLPPILGLQGPIGELDRGAAQGPEGRSEAEGRE